MYVRSNREAFHSLQRRELGMQESVIVVGVGMIPFTEPGSNEPYPIMATKAARAALYDARIGYDLVQQAYVGYVYGAAAV
jgi:hypothetical protein